jgi:hypothetical protein
MDERTTVWQSVPRHACFALQVKIVEQRPARSGHLPPSSRQPTLEFDGSFPHDFPPRDMTKRRTFGDTAR